MATGGNRAIRLEGAKCIQARAQRGFSRERLAEVSRGGLSVATLKRVEKGDPVYLDTARRLADLLEVPLRSLVPGSDPPPASSDGDNSPPTIAVLPFEVMDGNAEGRCFGDGLVEDLLTRLGRSWFPVISRNSIVRYAADRPEPQRVRAELGADYVIEGSIRRSAGILRVTARLTDTATARQLWACTYDEPMKDVFSVQDSLVAAIVGQVDGVVLDREYRHLSRRDPSDLNAWELSLRANWCFHRRTREQNEEARALFREALKRDQMLSLAWYHLALTHQREMVNQWSADPAASLREMKEVCAEFGRYFADDPLLSVATAFCAVYAGQRDSAMARLRDAIALDPNAATAYSLYGQTLAMAERPDEAIEQFEVAMRLSPRDSELWSIQTAVALCHFVAERYEDMRDWAERAIRTKADVPFAHGTLAVARAHLGQDAEARMAVESMIALEPRTSMRGAAAIVGSTSPEIAKRYLATLKRVGVPG